MSRSAILERVFVGEGHFDLCLRIGELIALQEKVGIGPLALANKFVSGDWHIQEVIETIRLGLIGGGMSQKDAFALVGRNVIPGHFGDYAGIAYNVVLAALYGVEDEPWPGEAETPATTIETTQED